MNNVEVFRDVWDAFENDNMKLYCQDMVAKISQRVMEASSSTSMKYHNATQCKFGGNAYHFIMVATLMNYMLGLDFIKEQFQDSVQRDCMRIAAILHDSKKLGMKEGNYTVFEHPLLSGEWVKSETVEHDIDAKLKDYIARLMASHSGQWTTSNRSKTVLPKPESWDQMLVHISDYLGSRSNLDMIYSDEVVRAICGDSVEIVQQDPDAKAHGAPAWNKESLGQYKYPMGKYSGKTLDEIRAVDEGYLIWVKEHLQDKRDVHTRVKNYCKLCGIK